MKDFLTKHAKKAVHPKLKVTHPMWAMPVIYGIDETGKTIEAVGIEDWRSDDIKEYLLGKLQ